MTSCRWVGGALLGGSLLVASGAEASNQEALPLGNEAALTGGAVTARSGDGGAVWYNPAGLAAADGTSLDVSASAFLLRIYDLPNAARVKAFGKDEPRDASFTEIVSVPSALSFVRRVSPSVVAALGVFVPDHEDLATSIEVSKASEPPSYEAVIAVSRRLTDYYAGPALGISLSPELRLGANLFGSYHTLRTSRDFRSDYQAPDASDVVRSTISAESRSDRRLFGGRAQFGLQADVSDSFHLGLTFRTPEVIVARVEEVDQGSATTLLAPGAEPQVDTQSSLVPSEVAETGALKPLRVTLAAAKDFPGGWVGLEGDLEPPFENAALGVDRLFVWNVRVGGRFALNEHVGLGAGFFTDRSPARTPYSLGNTQIDFYGGSVGMEFGSERKLVPEAEHREGNIRFLTTVALRYSRGHGKIGGLGFDPLAPPEDVVADVTIHELSGHIGTTLAF